MEIVVVVVDGVNFGAIGFCMCLRLLGVVEFGMGSGGSFAATVAILYKFKPFKAANAYFEPRDVSET